MASRNYSEEKHNDFNLFADTDTDGLYDFLEIKIDDGLIYFDENDIAVLPTFNDCKCYLEDEYFYVSSGYDRMCDEFNSHHDHYTLEYILGIVPVLPLNSDPTLEDSDADLLLDKIDNEPLVEIGDVSKCWLYKNGYDKIYKALYGISDYYKYDDRDVNNHHLELTKEIDENGNEISYYVCTEDCCNDSTSYEPVKFLSPSDEDDIMCGDDYKYSDGKYLLIKQLELASTYYLLAGNLKYSEALYHIVDHYREQNEIDWASTQGFKYQYSSNGHYVSPMKYTYSEDELEDELFYENYDLNEKYLLYIEPLIPEHSFFKNYKKEDSYYNRVFTKFIKDNIDLLESVIDRYPIPGYTVGVNVDNINVKINGGKLNNYGEANKAMPDDALFDIASMTTRRNDFDLRKVSGKEKVYEQTKDSKAKDDDLDLER